MKIGDIVLNHSAGDKNPYRVSIFIGMSGKNRKTLCFDGHISIYDKDVHLEVIGYIPIIECIRYDFNKLLKQCEED